MRFVIPKGKAFYCEFQVKEPGTAVALDLTNASGTFSLSTIGVEPELYLDNISLTFPQPENGIAAVTLTAAQTANLVDRRGFAEDGFPMIATYKAGLDIDAEHVIFVEIPQVYISNLGT